MRLFQSIFKNPSKTSNQHAKLNLDPKQINSQKYICVSKSQTHSQDNTWNFQYLDSSYYFDKIIEVKLGKTDVVPKSKQDKSHMIYEICILTSDFQYNIKKRFSLFNEFYSQIKKQISHLNIDFPKKTILVSGTNIEVVTERFQLLNNFIKTFFRHLQQQKSIVLEQKFINFLSTHEQYQKRRVKSYTQLPKYPLQLGSPHEFSVEDTSISFQLRKLNDYNNHQQDIISRLQNYISYRNHKITNDQIRTFLIGNSSQDLKGILNLSLSISNQIKSLELLRFLLDYISPEKKSYHDKIYKQFQKLPLQAFYFQYDKVKNSFAMVQFKQVFFIILQLYCQNKFFKESKILQKYPDLIRQFETWKHLYQLNQGNLCRKISSTSNLYNLDGLAKKPSICQEKAKSFQLYPKMSQTKPDSLYLFASTQNLDLRKNKSSQCQHVKSSFKSNGSTSQLTIQQEWENCKMNLELCQIQNFQKQSKQQILKLSQTFCFKTNKTNKMTIEIFKISKTMEQCEQISNNWNKLIYDERHDPFTAISRVYMKLNGKSKIFKYRKEDQKVFKKNQNMIKIIKQRLESYNSISKNGKQNVQQILKIKSSQNCNGFEEIITIQKHTDQMDEQFRAIKIQFNFEGQQEYFKTQLTGETTYLLDYAVQSFA